MKDIYYEKGLGCLQYKDFENAVLNFTESLKIEKSSGAYSNRAFAYYYLNQKDLSKEDFEKSIEITKSDLNKSQYKDSIYVDKCLVEIIRAKSTIAQIHIEQKNLIEAEMDYFSIMGIYKMINDEKSIPNNLHICQTYKNRGAVRYKLNKISDAVNDIAAAYVESNTNDVMMEIVDFAAMTGLTDKVKISIDIYSSIKSQ